MSRKSRKSRSKKGRSKKGRSYKSSPATRGSGKQAVPAGRQGSPPREFLLFFGLGILIAVAVTAVVRAREYETRQADPPPAPVSPAQETGPDRKPSRKELAESEQAFQRGYAYLRAERLGEAFKAFAAAAKLNPKDPRPHFGMAQALEELDYVDRAEQAYREALAINPGYHPATIELAQILCDHGKNEESLKLLNKAFRENPEDPQVWAEMAVNEIRLGNPDKAVALLEKYNKAMGKNSWGYEHLGRALADSGKLEAAEKAYREALAMNPYAELGHLWLGHLLVATGRKDEAPPIFKRFHELRRLQTQGRELEQAVARRPEDVRTHVLLLVRLAHVRHLLGERREALIPLQRALELTPEDPKLRKLYENQRLRAGLKPEREGP